MSYAPTRRQRWRRAISTLALLALAIATIAPPPTTLAGSQEYDLDVFIEASPDPAAAEGLLVLTIYVTNFGPGPVAGFTLDTATPDGTVFEEVSSTLGTCSAPAPGAAGAVRCIVEETLEADAVVEVTLVVRVTAEPGDELLVEASVTGPNDDAFDVDLFNNSYEYSVFVDVPATVADLSVEIAPRAGEAATGSLFTFDVTFANSPDSEFSADDVFVGVGVPEGATFSSARARSPEIEITAPDVGMTGFVFFDLLSLDAGESHTVEVTVAVTASPGSELLFETFVASAAEDPNETNDDAFVLLPVVASDEVVLDWEEPDLDSSIELPPPRNLVLLDDADAQAFRNVPEAPATLRQGGPIGYKIYRATQPGVVPGPSGLLTSIPATQTNAAVPAAPSGTFFVVTATYPEGESGPSNEVSGNVPAADVSRVSVKATKITAFGTGFSENVAVFVDGIPFATSAKLKKAGTKVIQKGALLSGQTIGQYMTGRSSVVIGFRNANGGVATFRHQP